MGYRKNYFTWTAKYVCIRATLKMKRTNTVKLLKSWSYRKKDDENKVINLDDVLWGRWVTLVLGWQIRRSASRPHSPGLVLVFHVQGTCCPSSCYSTCFSPLHPVIKNQKAFCDGQAWDDRDCGQNQEWKPSFYSPASVSSSLNHWGWDGGGGGVVDQGVDV